MLCWLHTQLHPFRYLGLVSSLGASVHRDTCGMVPGLVYEQVELCRNSPDTITCVGEGVRRGIYECQSQFKFERWNCTTTPNQSVFGPVLNNGKYSVNTENISQIHCSTTVQLKLFTIKQGQNSWTSLRNGGVLSRKRDCKMCHQNYTLAKSG